ncbi:MAG TPA: copper chaperone PCu(A)C [Pseudomonas xinjiangensis]|uniref:Copper chaperone PCu(A)C n=2 Tax=root TaxID=1 RepID=A0A7V1BRP1_9GAMM|nr:copper chaperone PCu(A)C [Halopseudomonas xinjiangensis]HEC46521.1 copper chaperone PCu(A)C [Halopseudomonas xinjiangensis]
MRHSYRQLISGLLLLAFSAMIWAADLEVTDARLRLLPGDLPAAGYFSLSNTSGESVVLVGAESPAFERVTVHQSTQDKGMASMEPVPHLELAPGDAVEFAPGGYHLMLMERQSPLALGDEVTVTLVFKDGQRLPVMFQAVSPTAQ